MNLILLSIRVVVFEKQFIRQSVENSQISCRKLILLTKNMVFVICMFLEKKYRIAQKKKSSIRQKCQAHIQQLGTSFFSKCPAFLGLQSDVKYSSLKIYSFGYIQVQLSQCQKIQSPPKQIISYVKEQRAFLITNQPSLQFFEKIKWCSFLSVNERKSTFFSKTRISPCNREIF